MKAKITVVFLLLSSSISWGQEQHSKLTNQVVKDDLAYLYETLQQTHYNLYAFRNKGSYDSLYSQLKNNLTADSLTLLETITFYQNLVSFANTGHCEIDFPAQPYIVYAYNNGTVFPLELAFQNNKALIRKNFSTNNQLTIGDEILSIDGKPIQEIQQLLYPFVSAEREYFKNVKIEFLSFPRLFFQLNGQQSQWLVQTKNAANEISTTRVDAISVMDYEGNRNGEILSPQKQVRFYENVAYLNAGPFGSSEVNGEALYKEFIDSCFLAIKHKKTNNLIIDLRNNPGGHNVYSDYLIGYFAHKPFKWYAKFSVKTSQLLKEQTKQYADTTDLYSKEILNNKNGAVFAFDFPAHQPVEKSKRYKGKVYVLINRQTYSMATVSAALIQDYKFGLLVGEETGDVPTLYASQFSYILPATGITVKVPKSYIVRVNGSEVLEGVKPDIYIQDHLLDDQDEILSGLLDKLLKTKRI